WLGQEFRARGGGCVSSVRVCSRTRVRIELYLQNGENSGTVDALTNSGRYRSVGGRSRCCSTSIVARPIVSGNQRDLCRKCRKQLVSLAWAIWENPLPPTSSAPDTA